MRPQFYTNWGNFEEKEIKYKIKYESEHLLKKRNKL